MHVRRKLPADQKLHPGRVLLPSVLCPDEFTCVASSYCSAPCPAGAETECYQILSGALADSTCHEGCCTAEGLLPNGTSTFCGFTEDIDSVIVSARGPGGGGRRGQICGCVVCVCGFSFGGGGWTCCSAKSNRTAASCSFAHVRLFREQRQCHRECACVGANVTLHTHVCSKAVRAHTHHATIGRSSSS
jgi:hypothetical protein